VSAVRRIARPLLAATFVTGGLDSYRHPGPRAKAAAPVVDKLAPLLRLPDDPELLVRANGAAMVVAGSLLALGKLPRLSALVLATSLVPTTAAGHRFWEVKDPAVRKQQQLHLMKNAGLLGGLLLAVVDTEGKPGVAWRAQRAVADTGRAAGLAKRDARRAAKLARREAKHAARTAGREARLAGHRVEDALPFD
jgi:putative oxidoreductase